MNMLLAKSHIDLDLGGTVASVIGFRTTEVGTISPGRQDLCAKISDNAPPGNITQTMPSYWGSVPLSAPIDDLKKTSRVSCPGAPFRNQG